MLIALDLEAAVREHHGDPVGPATSIAQAEQLADQLLASGSLGGVILDLRLQNVLSLDFAEKLRSLGVPVVIHSGQADATLPQIWPRRLIVAKPALPETVIAALMAAIARPQDDEGD